MKQLNRRDFLKVAAITGGAAALAACGAKATEEVAEIPAPEEPTKPAEEPVAPVAEGVTITTDFGTVEVGGDAVNPLQMPTPVAAEGVFFSGGFGHAYIQYAADLFAKVHPGSTMSAWKASRAWVRNCAHALWLAIPPTVSITAVPARWIWAP